ANAQHSTGPRTNGGKAASSRNALRHGLTARGFVILDGQESAFEHLESTLRDSLVPNGPLQEVIFKRALESAWNLERCRLAETTLHSRLGSPTLDPLLDDQNEPRYARIHKYARESENSMYKAMRELGKLQAEVRYRQEVAEIQPGHPELSTATTPMTVSEVCPLAQVMATVNQARRNEAKLSKPSERAHRIEANPTPLPPADDASRAAAAMAA
ncbi:MAG TPA: hypothetical protein VGL53_09715, partial [Bryobacteraceae bacterium]